jgi:hypothetical protein
MFLEHARAAHVSRRVAQDIAIRQQERRTGSEIPSQKSGGTRPIDRVLQTKFDRQAPVSKVCGDKFAAVPDHNEEPLHACGGESFENVFEHRPLAHGQHRLGQVGGDRPHSLTAPGGQYHRALDRSVRHRTLPQMARRR